MPDRADTAKNAFERRAWAFVEAADSIAKRVADQLDEPPANTRPLTAEQVRELWGYSPHPDPDAEFWRQHDQLLAEAQAAGDPDPHAVAEHGAMEEVYPMRLKLAEVGVSTIERQVRLADRLARLAGQQPAAQQTQSSHEGGQDGGGYG